jgi:hypothetical protein
VLSAIDAARQQLDRYALMLDEPAWDVVDAADLLDAVTQRLAAVVSVSPAIACVREVEA